MNNWKNVACGFARLSLIDGLWFGWKERRSG